MIERLRVGLGLSYSDQFDPLPPLPEEPDALFEEVPVEPDVVGLPEEPLADEAVAFGSEVVVTGGIEGALDVVPSGVPLEPAPAGPVGVLSPDGTEAVLPGSGVGTPTPLSSGVEPALTAPSTLLASPDPSALPPVAGVEPVVELTCVTEPLAGLADEGALRVAGPRDPATAMSERATPVTDG